MRIIAVTNAKGGSGKTTTAVNVAAALGELGRRVLVVDLDPQRNASTWLGAGRSATPTLADALAGEPVTGAQLVLESTAPGVSIIPADEDLATVERRIRVSGSGGVRLRRMLDGLADRFDVALIDCPPTVGFLVIAGITAADAVLVPVEASVLAVQGVGALLPLLEDLRDVTGRALPLAAVVPVRVKTGTNLGRGLVEGLRAAHGDVVTTATIRDTVRLAEAPHAAEPITVYDPTGAGADDYRALATELDERIERMPA